MRDDLHVGLRLPPRWKSVVRCLAERDWRGRAPSKARDALARELLESIRPGVLQNVRAAFDRGGAADLFRPDGAVQKDALTSIRRARQLTPAESKLIDYLEAHEANLNALNRHQAFAQSLQFVAEEQFEGVAREIIHHVSQKSVRDVPEVRGCLDFIASSLDVAAMCRDLAAGALQVAPRVRRPPIDIENEDLRPEAKRE